VATKESVNAELSVLSASIGSHAICFNLARSIEVEVLDFPSNHLRTRSKTIGES
jgi:hypothetical protein